MKINRNMSAVQTNSYLLRTENRLSASMERLSSGFKINHASDNPAGIAISNKMRAQIDALDQAEANASNGVSVIQIADGALNEVSSVLQRIRELSVQAANGTNSFSDRDSIQKEIDNLRREVDRVSANTEFNSKELLDGSSDIRVYAEDVTRIDISDTVESGNYTVSVTEAARQAEIVITPPQNAPEGDITINGVVMRVTAGMSEDEFFYEMRTAAEEADCWVERDGATGAIRLLSNRYGSNAEIELSVSKNLGEYMGYDQTGEYNEETRSYELVEAGQDAQVSIPTDRAGSGFSSTATVEADGNRVHISDLNGFYIDFLLDSDYVASGQPADILANGNLELEVTDIGTMTLQIGSNQYQTMDVRIPEVSVNSLYLDTVDVRVKKGAEQAMVTLDDAIAKLSEIRSRLGAYQNRLESAVSSLAETQENMTSAYSGLTDTDMAEEMTVYTQQNILDQATISVLSQANDLPQQVLSLLQR